MLVTGCLHALSLPARQAEQNAWLHVRAVQHNRKRGDYAGFSSALCRRRHPHAYDMCALSLPSPPQLHGGSRRLIEHLGGGTGAYLHAWFVHGARTCLQVEAGGAAAALAARRAAAQRRARAERAAQALQVGWGWPLRMQPCMHHPAGMRRPACMQHLACTAKRTPVVSTQGALARCCLESPPRQVAAL